MEYKNFFESQKEAVIRLQGTVVLYDGEPVEMVALTDHVGDGIIRAYVRPTGLTVEEQLARPNPEGMYNFPTGHTGLGKYLDDFIKDNPDSGIVRKHLSSPKFNKFRPFELGMCWHKDQMLYVERQPNRKTEQGLTSSMLVVSELGLQGPDRCPSSTVSILGPEMKRCIMGENPEPSRCLQGLLSDKYSNEAAAFHRHFAFVKGPADTLFLAYKTNVIGNLPNGDFSRVKLAADFKYCKEVVEELNLFTSIN